MAANPLKGEIDLVAGDKTYTLCFPSNVIVQVEKLLGIDSIGDAKTSSYDTVRTMFWGALQKHHNGVDLIKAGDLMDEAMDEIGGGLQALADPLVRALRFRVSGVAVDVALAVADEE